MECKNIIWKYWKYGSLENYILLLYDIQSKGILNIHQVSIFVIARLTEPLVKVLLEINKLIVEECTLFIQCKLAFMY